MSEIVDTFLDLSRSQFRTLLNQHTHPSEEIVHWPQLKGRNIELSTMQSCFSTPSTHVFIWGARGVGKTSLAKCAPNMPNSSIENFIEVTCQKGQTTEELFTDLVNRSNDRGYISLAKGRTKFDLSAYGFGFGVELERGKAEKPEKLTINQCSSILNMLFPPIHSRPSRYCVILDEFDQIESSEINLFLSQLMKKVSTDNVNVCFIICGIFENMGDLFNKHKSLFRYLRPVKVNELTKIASFELIQDICADFRLIMSNNDKERIWSIALGYPHFIHLIVRRALEICYDMRLNGTLIDTSYVDQAIVFASEISQPILHNTYAEITDSRTKSRTHALWSCAMCEEEEFSGHQVYAAYCSAAFSKFRVRNIQKSTLLKNVGSLCSNSEISVLRRKKSGVYAFSDPLFKSYVRMEMEREKILLDRIAER